MEAEIRPYSSEDHSLGGHVAFGRNVEFLPVSLRLYEVWKIIRF